MRADRPLAGLVLTTPTGDTACRAMTQWGQEQGLLDAYSQTAAVILPAQGLCLAIAIDTARLVALQLSARDACGEPSSG